MKKSVYSLVLMDEVVDQVDQLAYAMGTNRSNLINQILAQRVSLITPEMRLKAVVKHMEEVLNEHTPLQFQHQTSPDIVNIKSILKYKYNPTIRYSVCLYREFDPVVGEIKMLSRSQNDTLQRYLSDFFNLWTVYEQEVGLDGWHKKQEGRWHRSLKQHSSRMPYEELAKSIVTYIRAVDEGLKLYCQCIDEGAICHQKLEEYFISVYSQKKLSV